MTAYTYILRCSDDSLYTGWTTDLKRRLREHNSEELGAKYTRVRRPCRLVYYESFQNEDEKEAKRSAMKREWFIKNKMTKKQKEELIKKISGEYRIMDIYKHTVQYYETDKMGITHHSNYIRWMEEARVSFMSQIGWDYAKLEKEGVICPVVGLDCSYKESTTFSDVIEIEVAVKEFKGVKLKLSYIMKNADGKIVFEGNSEHCFLNEKGGLIRLNRSYPELYDALVSLIIEN